MMKNIILLLSICLLPNLSSAVNNSIFNGGSGSGFSGNCFSQADIINPNNNIFSGGASRASITCYLQPEFIQNNFIFSGGAAAGVATGCYEPLNNIIYNGGFAGGTTVMCYDQPFFIINNAIFSGGVNDGSYTFCFLQPDFILNNFIYNGGNSSGFGRFCYVFDNPLPVELIQFTASVDENRTKVNWTTASEINNDFFMVQRTPDGNLFDDVKKMKGAGNSSNVLNYQCFDEKPLSGKSYYRLKQVDFDGATSYSNLVAVNFDAVKNSLPLVIYPNPQIAGGIINVQYTVNGDAEKVLFKIYDLSGRILYSVTKDLQHNGQALHIPTSDMKSGIYFLSAQSDLATFISKIVLN